ncbi:Anti-apoptotic Bcl-2-like protein [Eptesipox virus]|uniref:Anti-apoptotic Bcl-2-like protein n=1 Tax=Eptesipox virus TaxID=1329402 RepID=A0A220T6M8_9POXV|nr:Anti-apoptotic Bcl-2-like protein [Eptesipox virus]ASK51363.1 Anti-apoptotic Bcl-2-like protein [Eptesipox virus]
MDYEQRDYLYPSDDIKDVISEYIKWRSYNSKNNYGMVFKTFKEFEKQAELKFGSCMYTLIKPMKLSISDGPRMDKIDTSTATATEIIGLCANMANYIGEQFNIINWETVFKTLFDVLQGHDLNIIKMSLYTNEDKLSVSNKFM